MNCFRTAEERVPAQNPSQVRPAPALLYVQFAPGESESPAAGFMNRRRLC